MAESGTRLIVACVGAIALSLAAGQTRAADKPEAELVFKDARPAVAPRLAAECSRRLMDVIRNTPDQVVCKHRERFTAEGPFLKASELWTFVLTAIGDKRTRVQGRAMVEAATDGGHAVVSFAGFDDGAKAMRTFLDEVRALDGLRGKFLLRPDPLAN